MSEEAWRQVDDWYWQGPDGWTICKVWVRGAYQFEIWRSGGQSAVDTRPSFETAKARYDEIMSA